MRYFLFITNFFKTISIEKLIGIYQNVIDSYLSRKLTISLESLATYQLTRAILLFLLYAI